MDQAGSSPSLGRVIWLSQRIGNHSYDMESKKYEVQRCRSMTLTIPKIESEYIAKVAIGRLIVFRASNN